MENIKELLIWHWEKYPLMEIRDAVKLLFQSEYAGGHIISDANSALGYLVSEMNSITHSSKDLFESIGKNVSRLNLHALENNNITQRAVNKIFIASAINVKSDDKNFINKLSALVELSKEGRIPVSYNETEKFVNDYLESGIKAVHHSAAYRDAYYPAYRVILNKYTPYFELIIKIDQLLSSRDKVILAIDGMAGSGKSSLSKLLAEIFTADIISMDDFFLPSNLRTPERMSEIGGNIHYERFISEVINPLKNNHPPQYRIFDCDIMDYSNTHKSADKNLIICEGSYSTHPKFEDIYDLKITTRCQPEKQTRRILERSGEALLERFISEWIPMEEEYFDKYGTYNNSDFVFNTD